MTSLMHRLRARAARPGAMAVRTVSTTDTAASPPPAVWAPPDIDDGAHLEGIVRADVCVVGLGVAGLTAVLDLAAAGRDVIGVDAGPIGGAASSRNAGTLRAGLAHPHHRLVEQLGTAAAVELHRATLDELVRLADDGGLETSWPGSVRLAGGSDELAECRAEHDALRRDGLPVEQLDGDEPGLLLPADGVCDPAARVRLLAERARAAGARLHGHTQARHTGEHDTTTPSAEIRSRTVLIAVDGGLDRTMPALSGVVRSARMQMLATGPGAADGPTLPTLLRHGRDLVRRLDDGRLLVCRGADERGDHDWTHDPRPSDSVQRSMDALLSERYDIDPALVTHRWAASTGVTPDGLPRLARIGRGTIALGGYAGQGNVVASMLGRAAAEMARGRTPQLVELLTA